MTTSARDRAIWAIHGIVPCYDNHLPELLVDAVLNAIREPDQAMVDAAYEAKPDPAYWAIDDDSDFRSAFTAAIDAARGRDA